MPSHIDAVRRAVRALTLAAALVVLATAATAQPRPAPGESPGEAEISRTLDTIKADPNLATERKIRTLRWKDSSGPPSGLPAWLAWIVGLVRWFAQSARVLIWVAVAMLAALLALYIARMVRTHDVSDADGGFIAPTHVRDLDIRPESLPADIGATARALWDRGEHRAALALLYRGLLSRLAHLHRVPIRDSSTEGDCLTLAAAHLEDAPREYVSRLVHVWQRAVYGGEHADGAAVHTLCDEFRPALDRPRSAGSLGAPLTTGHAS